MTVKERLRQLVDELPEDVSEAAIGAAEQLFRSYRAPSSSVAGEGTPEIARLTGDKRRAAVRALYGSCRGARPGLEEFLREKREETEREEREQASRG